MTDSPPPSVRITFDLPDHLRAGSYANTLSVWYSEHEFTLDFAVEQPAEDTLDDLGRDLIWLDCTVVARIRLPPSAIFHVMQSLNTHMTLYERDWGPIHVPSAAKEPPLYPPGDLRPDPEGPR